MIRYLFFIFIFLSNLNFAQQFTKSPFSVNGLGEEDQTGNASFSALGNTRSVYIDSSVLNIYNPASYSFLSHGQPIFSTSTYVQNYQFVQNGITAKNNTIAFNHIAFGFSFINRFGLVFGIRPFTNTGYDIVSKSFDNNINDTLTKMLFGSGNLTYAFSGISYKILNLTNHKLAFGINAGNIFGTNVNRQTISLKNELVGSVRQQSIRVNGFYPEFGINYQFLVNKSSNISLSATYKSRLKLNSEFKTALIAASDFKNEGSFDTLSYSLTNSQIATPTTLEAGFKYDFTKYLNRQTLKIPQIIFLASYKLSKFSEQNNPLFNTILLDSKQFNLGFQFAPHVDFYDRSKSISFFSRVRYRIGFERLFLPWSLNNKQVKANNYSLGLGLPITSQRTLSSLNFAVTYGMRTNGSNEDYLERYLTYSIGISISPAFYDRWFKKNKID